MALSFAPVAPWHWFVLALSIAMLLALAGRGLVDRWSALGRLRATRIWVAALSALAALVLCLVAWNPMLEPERGDESNLLVLVLDVSDSVLRADGGWPGLREELVEHLRARTAELPSDLRRHTKAAVVAFGARAAPVIEAIPIDQLAGRVATLQEGSLAPREASDLAAGLAEAGRLIAQAGGAGHVLLVSDGNETQGDARAQARALAATGVSIQVVPVEAGRPGLGIAALDLPETVAAGSQTTLRGVLSNTTGNPIDALLTLQRNAGLVPRPDFLGAKQLSAARVSIADWARLHQPLQFDGFGMQYLEVTLAEGGMLHRRRVFTQVARPPQVLVIGGDTRWTTVVPESLAKLTMIAPEALAKHAIAEYDAVVLSGVAADRFSTAQLTGMADAVKVGGMGLFMVNGGQRDPERPTVLASYKNTPLVEVLPIHPGPRPYMPDPPPRQVVLMIDTSGSMEGDGLELAKVVASYIVANLLRPKDLLDILTFTTDVGHPIEDLPMDESGKDQALAVIEGLKTGGGTDPRAALSLLANRRMSDCGLIFISDGGFDEVAIRPDCRATVFAVNQTEIPANSPLHDLADPFVVGPGFDPSEITIPYFNPKPRKKFWEDEFFVPLPIQTYQRSEESIPMPKLTLSGSAVSYGKDESEIIAVRPKLTDPILAFMDAGRGRTGVFCAELAPDFFNQREAREAIPRWVREVLGFTERDRYSIRVVDRGEYMNVRICLLAKQGKIPAVDQLSVTLDLESGSPLALPMRADPIVPGLFEGQLLVPRQTYAQRASLRLVESGSEAALRAQRIPLVVPPGGTVASVLRGETLSQGLDEALLVELCNLGGGRYNPPADSPLLQRRGTGAVGRPLRNPLMALAALLLFAAFALRRLDP